MAKEIIDIYVEQGYPYDFILDFNASDGTNLENDYTVTFYSEYIGYKTFNAVNNALELILTSEDTGKITSNLSKYVVYAVNNSTSERNKLLTGRIILDKKVGA